MYAGLVVLVLGVEARLEVVDEGGRRHQLAHDVASVRHQQRARGRRPAGGRAGRGRRAALAPLRDLALDVERAAFRSAAARSDPSPFRTFYTRDTPVFFFKLACHTDNVDVLTLFDFEIDFAVTGLRLAPSDRILTQPTIETVDFKFIISEIVHGFSYYVLVVRGVYVKIKRGDHA